MVSVMRLQTLHAARGIAATLVVLFHAPLVVQHYYGVDPLSGLFSFGYLGVPFFFVLSGFVIMWAHGEDIGHPERLVAYAGRRFMRVFPVYWAVLGGTLAIATMQGREIAPEVILGSLILAGEQSNTVLSVAWSLFHEVAFYIAFGAAIFSARLGAIVMGGWIALCLAAPSAGYLASPVNLMFVFGIVLAWGAKHTSAGIAALRLERRINVPQAMLALGDSSFSIYLIHFSLMFPLVRLLPLPPLTLSFALPVITIAAGLLFHRFVERPLVTALRRPRKARPATLTTG